MYEGWNVPIDYDPLLAKLIGYGASREEAIARLQRALYEYFVGGIKTNISLFKRILSHPDFREGKLDTGFLDRLLANPQPASEDERHEDKARVAAIAAGLFSVLEPLSLSTTGGGSSSPKPDDVTSAWKKAARAESLRSQ
jgi:acetyl-CoA carboxylase biotin carboxylase subunit